MKTVRRRVWLTVLGSRDTEAPRLRVTLSWSERDPGTVSLRFATHAGPLHTAVSTRLLEHGLHGPAERGEVSVLPDLAHPNRRELIFTRDGQRTGFGMHAGDLAGFLHAITAPRGDQPARSSSPAGPVTRHRGAPRTGRCINRSPSSREGGHTGGFGA